MLSLSLSASFSLPVSVCLRRSLPLLRFVCVHACACGCPSVSLSAGRQQPVLVGCVARARSCRRRRQCYVMRVNVSANDWVKVSSEISVKYYIEVKYRCADHQRVPRLVFGNRQVRPDGVVTLDRVSKLFGSTMTIATRAVARATQVRGAPLTARAGLHPASVHLHGATLHAGGRRRR